MVYADFTGNPPYTPTRPAGRSGQVFLVISTRERHGIENRFQAEPGLCQSVFNSQVYFDILFAEKPIASTGAQLVRTFLGDAGHRAMSSLNRFVPVIRSRMISTFHFHADHSGGHFYGQSGIFFSDLLASPPEYFWRVYRYM